MASAAPAFVTGPDGVVRAVFIRWRGSAAVGMILALFPLSRATPCRRRGSTFLRCVVAANHRAGLRLGGKAMKGHATHAATPHTGRRWVRTAIYTLLSNPHVLVTVPLALAMLTVVLVRVIDIGVRPVGSGFSAAVVCYGCIAGVIIFAVLAVGGAVMSILYAWRNREP